MSFFGGMPFPVQFFLAFVIVLGLIGATAWAVRRFGAGRLGGMGTRGRQPRLAVVDYASVDGRRRLLLIRRDNVEHLVMIGGPTDVVVESNIVRASAAPREIAATRPPAALEAASRAIALPDSGANGSWTGHPEPAVPANGPRLPRGEITPEEPVAIPLQPHSESQPRAQREPLAALADELTTKSVTPPRNRQAPARPQQFEPRQEGRQEPRADSRQEPHISASPPVSADAAAADQSLAEMAHRLEAALRKPSAKTGRSAAPEPRVAPPSRAAAPAEHAAPVEPAAPGPVPPPLTARPARSTDTKPPRVDAKQPDPGKTLYDSLEQEMASLLGRPTAKH
jgi:flagellar protein FliO/FliZ